MVEFSEIPPFNVVEFIKWETPASKYPEKEFGTARIVHDVYREGYYRNYKVRGYDYFQVIKPITITMLQTKENEKWDDWFVDDPPHWWSMEDYALRSMGKVLVAGLGLGLVIYPLLDNVDVESITVVEINKDVIDLIVPLLPITPESNIKIIHDNFYDFINKTKEKYDRIIVDIWRTESLEETRRLLKEEVEPLAVYLMKLFPDASVVFHGFGLEW